MRMNEISWQRKVYMNHSANIVLCQENPIRSKCFREKSFLSLKHKLGTLF